MGLHNSEESPSFKNQNEVLNVSIIQLISNPEKYKGKLIRVIGHVRIAFEGNAIYLHREDLEHSLTINALALAPPDEIIKNASFYNNKIAYVVGVFDTAKGHGGMYSGSITKIKSLDIWTH